MQTMINVPTITDGAYTAISHYPSQFLALTVCKINRWVQYELYGVFQPLTQMPVDSDFSSNGEW